MIAASSKKVEIMDVTTDLLLNNSYANVNMSAIAKTCGITKAGIYYHFKNKEELIHDCLKSSLDKVNSILGNHSSESITVRDKLHVISTELYALGIEKPGILTLFTRSISEPEMRELLAGLHEEVDMFMRELGEIIRSGFKTGEVRSSVNPLLAARMLAGTFMMQLQHVVLMRKVDEFKASDAVDLLFDGIKSI